MYHIIKTIYSEYRERNKKARAWIDFETQTIHIDGGGMTVNELYNEVQKQLKDATSVNPFIIDEE